MTEHQVSPGRTTRRLTVAQAVVEFLRQQHSERDGQVTRLVPGCFGIFGHGNVAGLGQALLQSHQQDPAAMPYWLARNEQGMVHAAIGYARMTNRLSTLACTASVGPGSTNMLTGAALASINRLPVLLLPSDTFATRPADPVLQQLEYPVGPDVTVNDAFRPLSRFFDRVDRPEQLPSALLGAMRILTDPAETGAATICLPQDVQAEAYDWPVSLFERRVWRVARPAPDPASLADVLELVRTATRPLIVAGGGVIYSDATDALREFVDATGIPVADTQAGKGSLPHDHPAALGSVGATGTTAANAVARSADLIIGVGTRYTDFTTASGTGLGHAQTRFVNINVTASDAVKQTGLAVVGDARLILDALRERLEGWRASADYRAEYSGLAHAWAGVVDAATHLDHRPVPAQSAIIGAVNEAAEPGDVVVGAAGSLPGDLHKLWRARLPRTYHVEYGYSCMGYEIAGGLGVKMAAPDREVFVLVGDGSYLMMAQELVTAVAEQVKLIVVLVDNHGFGSIGALSESLGSQRFGTQYRYRDAAAGGLTGEVLPTDLAANAASLGARVLCADTIPELREALQEARAHVGGPVVIRVPADPSVPAPSSDAWWEVPVAEVSELDSTRAARAAYEVSKRQQRT
ncbi:3D-(3,5/4)-trihydroxycyclohexane-1,2-dione acylhydrolase (decyclizing) [Nocardioides sp. YIM 152315]|uniref:3D-(3,5/4)-trihydroxycyclohexane-1,2-dione acylhydrolase (decyclizing) n=1 Tax=Nocardioides sp. YIM 152315 TaxID=3031760 RepID=UPI0023DA5A79|nr:3D-(3,5/4)-trihydroxycyclohexane-1,2-dione acylhydrolase (decyclizing) [Nocardioides sp. YIM 152315]MDF1605470.1 3D-(3,5/4)-trihydroxycyclohexane-1,2-dione acylhydrolase (decyclizing) [Nocardioides sp. YIM 152315]